MQTLLELPFFYTRTGLVARARTPDTEVLVGTCPVLVSHINSADAPVVATCRYRTSCFLEKGGKVDTEPCDSSTDYRLASGGGLMRRAVFDTEMFLAGADAPGELAAFSGFLRPGRRSSAPWDFRDAGISVPDITTENVHEAMATYAVTCRVGMLGLVPRLPGEAGLRRAPRLEADSVIVRQTGSDRAARAAEMAAAVARGGAFVDGVLYVPSLGPGWSYKIKGDGTFQAWAEPELCHVSPRLLGEIYPCVGMKAIHDFARAKVPEGTHAITGDIEIVASGLPWHPDDLMFRGVAAEFVESARSRGMKDMGAAALRAVANLIDYIESPAGSCDPVSVLPDLDAVTTSEAAHQADGAAGQHWMQILIREALEKAEARMADAPAAPQP